METLMTIRQDNENLITKRRVWARKETSVLTRLNTTNAADI
jgi:hypothetical protein